MKCPCCSATISARARFCPKCGESLAHPPNPQTSQVVHVNVPVYMPRERRWSPGVAALLSFLIPGAGQIYKGHIIRGLLWMLVVVLGYMAFIIPGLVLHLLCIVMAAAGDPYR